MESRSDVSVFTDCTQLTKLLHALAQLRQEKDAQSLPNASLSTGNNNQRILIFGTGEAGKKFFDMFSQKYQVIAFIDNDKSKQGTSLKDLPILSPLNINTVSFDMIYIASQYYRAIYQQLVHDLAIPAEKIKY